MGQKVDPNIFRLGIVRAWNATWYAERKEFASTLQADVKVRAYLKRALSKAGLARVLIERPAKSISVTVSVARPGVAIGKKGEDIERLRSDLAVIAQVPVQLSIIEVKKPELDATLIADNVASQLERRILFRRATRRAIQTAMRSGAQGIKVQVSGRLNGAEIARQEWHREGRVPLHTLRADIDYGVAQAKTTYGVIGVKVWVFKGEVLGPKVSQSPSEECDSLGRKSAAPARPSNH